MPVANSERCDYVDPKTGKRCGRRATYLGDGKFCEGIGHDPDYPDDEETNEEQELELEAIFEDESDAPEDFADGSDDTEEIEKIIGAVDALHKIMAPKDGESRVCACGCGEPVAKGRIYEQGHDQRHKGILIRNAILGDNLAMETLIQKGWRTREYIVERRTKEMAKQERKLAKINKNKEPGVTVIMDFEPQ